MQVFPIRASMYVQDKIEFQEFTVNAGLRLDYTDSQAAWWDLNPFDGRFFLSDNSGNINYDDTNLFPKKESEPQWQLSPRLGISHPITENSKLFLIMAILSRYHNMKAYSELSGIRRVR